MRQPRLLHPLAVAGIDPQQLQRQREHRPVVVRGLVDAAPALEDVADVVVDGGELEQQFGICRRQRLDLQQHGLRRFERGLRVIQFALVPARGADVGQDLGMGQLALDIGGRGLRQLRRQCGGGLVTVQGLRQMPLVDADIADLDQCLRALFERLFGDIGGRKRFEERHRFVVHRFHDVQSLDLRELVGEVAEHETDQRLGLLLPPLGSMPRDHRLHREETGHQHHQHRQRGDGEQALMAPRRFALAQGVQVDAEQSGQQFQPCQRLAVLAGTDVGGDRFGRLRAELAIGIDLEAQRRHETFAVVAGTGFAVDDEAADAIAAADALEPQHFVVDPRRARGVGRADHDQRLGVGERGLDLRGQSAGACEVLAIAEDRTQAIGQGTELPCGAAQPPRQLIALERAMQPARPACVFVAVTDEGAIAHPSSRTDRRVGCRRTGYLRERMPGQAKRSRTSRRPASPGSSDRGGRCRHAFSVKPP